MYPELFQSQHIIVSCRIPIGLRFKVRGTHCSYIPRRTDARILPRYLNLFRADLKTFSYHRYPVSHCGGHVVTKADLMSDHAVEGQVIKIKIIDTNL